MTQIDNTDDSSANFDEHVLGKMRAASKTVITSNATCIVLGGLAYIFGFKPFTYACIAVMICSWVYSNRFWTKMKNDPTTAPMVKEYKRQQAVQARAAKVPVKHLSGFETLGIAGTCTLYATDEGLVVERTQKRLVIPWVRVEDVDAGTDEELRKRVTLTRVLALGIFALGVKKEKTQNFYVTIAIDTAVGLFSLNTGSKDNKANQSKARVFEAACKTRIKAASVNKPKPVIVESAPVTSAADQLEKLAALHEKGLLTLEEFEGQKAQILGNS